jgi:subtilase family protein
VYPGKEGLHRAQSGHGQAGRDLCERLQNERPLVQPRVRDLEVLQGNLRVAVEEEVEVERPRPLGRGRLPVAPEGGLDREEPGEQVGGLERRLEHRDPVQERRLIEIADRLGLAEGGHADDLDPLGRAELVQRRTNRLLPAAEIRAEPDIRPCHAREATLALLVRRRLLAVMLAALAIAVPAAAATVAADPLAGGEWWLADIGADRAVAPGPGVPIIVVDSGVDPTHPEFAGRPNTTYLNGQTVAGAGEYHGTAVASLIAAPANGVGLVGVYPQANLQVFDASADATSGINRQAAAAGILAAAQHCPGVINLSFSSVEPDPLLHDAVLTAARNGCLVVASAGNMGNNGSPEEFPGSWPHVVTAGSTDQLDQPSIFSTASPGLDVSAPGTAITAAVPASQDPSGYESGLSGTSSSAALVSAAAAWIWTLRPTLTAAQVAAVLRRGARDVAPAGFDNATGWGIVDIPRSLAAPAPPIDPSEPNDDVDEVEPSKLFELGQQPLTTASKPAGRIAASLDTAEDPRDLYRIWVPARKVVRAKVAGGLAAARIWGPRTVSVDEGLTARRRDLRGPSIRGGSRGAWAYAEVLLTGRSAQASYVLTVTASRR